MSESGDDLSGEELDALLRELEGRSGGGSGGGARSKKAPVEDDGEDLEAFLKSLESEDAAPPPNKTATVTAPAEDDPFAAQFAELAAADEKAMVKKPAPEKEKKPTRAEKKAARAEAKAVEKADKDGAKPAKSEDSGATKQRILLGLKVFAVGLPLLVLWWTVGSYLSQWVSAGWLVLLVSTTFVLGLPYLLKKLVKRGRYAYWLVGACVALSAALIAPIPNTAGEAMANYGHWPSTALAEVTGLELDHAIVRANAAVGSFLGGALGASEAPHLRLGTDQPLRADQAPAPAAEPGVVPDPGVVDDTPTPIPSPTTPTP